jgi:DNA-binding transcriptional regulator YhcF (GntR family)
MDFKEHKPIYLQIADTISNLVLSGTWKEGDRIPSVRELGTNYGVNPNTVARAYDSLQDQGIIQNKRGIGFFICPDASQKLAERERKAFVEEELVEIFKKIEQLRISDEDLHAEWKKWKNKQNLSKN